jgi:hypothetical protein
MRASGAGPLGRTRPSPSLPRLMRPIAWSDGLVGTFTRLLGHVVASRAPLRPWLTMTSIREFGTSPSGALLRSERRELLERALEYVPIPRREKLISNSVLCVGRRFNRLWRTSQCVLGSNRQRADVTIFRHGFSLTYS